MRYCLTQLSLVRKLITDGSTLTVLNILLKEAGDTGMESNNI